MRKVKSTKFDSNGIVLVVFVPTKNTGPNRPSNENLWPFYVTALVFMRYTLEGQENFVGMWKKNLYGLDHVPKRLDNRKMVEIM